MIDKLILRNIVLSRARKKYIPSHTMNISTALKLYLENNATKNEQVPLLISKKDKPKNWIDNTGRPSCPKCASDLFLRPIMTPRGPSNKLGWASCWECLNCGHEDYSRKSIFDWQVEFEKSKKLKEGL